MVSATRSFTKRQEAIARWRREVAEEVELIILKRGMDERQAVAKRREAAEAAERYIMVKEAEYAVEREIRERGMDERQAVALRREAAERCMVKEAVKPTTPVIAPGEPPYECLFISPCIILILLVPFYLAMHYLDLVGDRNRGRQREDGPAQETSRGSAQA